MLVGVARDMILNPKSVAGGFIYTFRLVAGGEKLEFVHKVGSRLDAVNQGPAFCLTTFLRGWTRKVPDPVALRHTEELLGQSDLERP